MDWDKRFRCGSQPKKKIEKKKSRRPTEICIHYLFQSLRPGSAIHFREEERGGSQAHGRSLKCWRASAEADKRSPTVILPSFFLFFFFFFIYLFSISLCLFLLYPNWLKGGKREKSLLREGDSTGGSSLAQRTSPPTVLSLTHLRHAIASHSVPVISYS